MQRADAATDTLPAPSRIARDASDPSWILNVRVDPFTEGAWAPVRVRENVSVADALHAAGLPNDDSVKVEIDGVALPADKRHMVRPKENRVVSAEPTPAGPGTAVAAILNIYFQTQGAHFAFMAITATLGTIYDYRLQQKNRNRGGGPTGSRIDATGSNNGNRGAPLPIVAGEMRIAPPLAMTTSSEYIGETNDQFFKTAVFWGHAPMAVRDRRFGSTDGENAVKTEAEIIDASDEWARHDFDGKGDVIKVDRIDETRLNVTPSSDPYTWESDRQTDRITVEIAGDLLWYHRYITDQRDGSGPGFSPGTGGGPPGTPRTGGSQPNPYNVYGYLNGEMARTIKVEIRRKPTGRDTGWRTAMERTFRIGSISASNPYKLLLDGGEDPRNPGERLGLPEGRGIYQLRITGTYSETSPYNVWLRTNPQNAQNPDDRPKYPSGTTHKTNTLAVRKVLAVADEANLTRAGVAASAYKIRLPSTESRVVREINGIAGMKVLKYNRSRRRWPDDTPRNRRSAGRFGVSKNPADWFLAYLTSPDVNRAPQPRSAVDLENLGDWWEFCEDNGLRWSFANHAGLSLNEILNDVAAAGLAQPVLSGKWGVVIDRAVPRATQLLTPRNTANFRLQADKVPVPHAYRVSFPNEDTDWEEDMSIVYRTGYDLDDGRGVKRATLIEDLDLPGVTNSAQVYRLARHRLAALLHRPHLVTLDIDYAAMAVELGDRVTLTHDAVLQGQAWGRVRAVRNETGSPVSGPAGYSAWGDPRAFSPRTPALSDFTAAAEPSKVTIGQFAFGAVDAPLGYRYDGAYATWIDGNTWHWIAAFGSDKCAWRTYTRSNASAPWAKGPWNSGPGAYLEDDADRVAGNSRAPAIVQFGKTINMPGVLRAPQINPQARQAQSFAILEDIPEGAPTSLQRVHQAYWGKRTWERRVTRSAGQRGVLVDLDDIATFEAGKTYRLIVTLQNGELASLPATAPSNLPGGVGSTRIVRVARASGVQEGDLFSFGEAGSDFKVAAIEPLEEGRATLSLVNYGGDAVFNAAEVIPGHTPVVHKPVSPTLTGPLPPILDDDRIVSDESALPVDLKGTPTPTILVPFEMQSDDPANPRITSADHVTFTYVVASDSSAVPFPPVTVPASAGRAYLPNVKAGVTYDITAVAYDREAGFSRPARARHTAVGLAARPPAVLDFDMEVAGDSTNFTWEFPPDMPRDVVAAEIRYASNPDTANWDEMAFVARVSVENTAKTLPTINGAYAIKLVDAVGSYSETPFIRRMRLANPPVPLNVEASRTEDSAWSGTKTDVEVRNGTLELRRVVTAAADAPRIGNQADPSVPDFDTIGEVERLGSVAESTRFAERGTYTGGVLDLTAVYDVVVDVARRVAPSVNITQLLKDVDPWSALETMSGTPGDDATLVRVQIRTATEDPTSDPARWDNWHDVTRARVTARWIQARIVLTTRDTNVTPVIEAMTLNVRAVQQVLRGSATSAQQDKEIAFSPAFEDDDVDVVLQQGNDAAAGEKAVLVSASKGKFSFKVVNASGTRVADRSVTWIAVGWGRRGD